MGELLHLGRHIRTCCGEEIAFLQSQLLAYQREQSPIERLILQLQRQRSTFALADELCVVLPTNGKSPVEQLPLHGIGLLDFLLHADIHLFPETGNGAHTGRMHLLQRLLDLLRVGIDDNLRTLCQTQDDPSPFKDMGNGKEVHDAVVLSHGYTFVVGLKGSMILSVGEDDSFRVACGTAGIEDIGYVIPTGLLPQHLHFRLSWKVLAQLHEVIEVDGTGITVDHPYRAVEHDDLLERRTGRQHAVRLVILFLLAHKEETDFRVSHDMLNLLFTTGGIKRYGNGTDTESAEIGIEIMHGILRKHTDVFLNTHSHVQQGITHLLDTFGELVPRNLLPFQTTELSIVQYCFLSVFLCLLMDEH